MPRELEAYLCKMQFQLILVVQLLQKAQACLSETFFTRSEVERQISLHASLAIRHTRAQYSFNNDIAYELKLISCNVSTMIRYTENSNSQRNMMYGELCIHQMSRGTEHFKYWWINKLTSTLTCQLEHAHTASYTQHHMLIRISFMLRHTAESMGGLVFHLVWV